MAKNILNKSIPGYGCLALFSLPFAGVSVAMAVWLMSSIVAYMQMSAWEETPAIVIETKLSDSDGESCQATAEYEYQYDGRKYTGTRVAIDGGSDNIGSFQQDAFRQLSEHHKSGRPFRCFVNPANPAEAVLFRDLRWEMILFKLIFVLAFGTAGFGLLIGAIIGSRKHRESKKLAAARPDEPWLHNADWAAGRTKSSNKIQAVVTWAIAIFWNSISSGVALAVMDENAPPFIYIFLIFPVIGVGMIVAAIIVTRRYFKYGESFFQMASVPGVVGGQLAGVIHINTRVQPSDGFLLKLSCHKQAGEDDHIEWEEEQIVHGLRQIDPSKSAVPVLFNIPFDCLETSESLPVAWQLDVSAKDYKATFTVPVFKTPESDPNFKIDRDLISEYTAPDDPERALREAGVRKTLSPTGDGIRLVFPMLRNPGTALMLFTLGLIFCGVPFLIYYMESTISFPVILFGLLFGIAGPLIVAFSVCVAFYRSTVDVSRQGMTIVGGLFGRDRRVLIEASDIDKIELKSRMSSGEGRSKISYFDIDVVRSSGSKVTAGKRIPGRKRAESIVRQIEQAMGREPVSREGD